MLPNQRLKQLRQQAGYTLEYVGEQIGVSKQTMQRYESGVIANIPKNRIEELARVYSTTPEYIMGWETTPEDSELDEYLQQLRTRPEMRMYFSLAKGATKEDVETAVRIVEAYLKGKKEETQ